MTRTTAYYKKTIVILQRPPPPPPFHLFSNFARIHLQKLICHFRTHVRGGDKALPLGLKNCATSEQTLTTYEPSAMIPFPSSSINPCALRGIEDHHLEKPNSATCPLLVCAVLPFAQFLQFTSVHVAVMWRGW